ncbi:NAD-dependent succinate-semialdehyde dehydrogenase [Futiania mangrovi]|uniref:NAD-dependent succinate-semialdehyde dehydrogenase n=1 Tax=Futiania mangrovi TaxID=2959716 RepID=A0A9J6PEP5_9PROT|nr:NAD-dependent succinate-semialdehyde dehydrogenase [Futiania mangrovii]MCP1336894.1 NAD-dependent succinate-semialdehyde dehydrogenase [Futiania mangrovii]
MSATRRTQTASRDADAGLGLAEPGLLRVSSWIGGAWDKSSPAGVFAVTNPADGEEITGVLAADADRAAAAVDAAHRAFGPWSRLLPQERADVLKRWHALILEHKEDLARLMTLEQGKPVSEARGEIDYGASFVEFFAEEAKRPDIMSVTSHLNDAEVEVWREPVGVAALVTPWNFPNAMLTRKAAAALAIGCTVVAHPSRETPLSALALAELAARAGLPAGVFNVVVGDAAEIVGTWTQDTRVRALSFTGSTGVGRLLYEQCAPTIKRLSLELGGHAPFIVFADADLDKAVREAIKAKFATSGQDCLGANRFFVERPVYAAFCEKFAEAARALSVGNGLEDPDIGPLMNDRAIAKQREHVDDAVARGAKVLCGGGVMDLGPLFFAPTVLADVPDAAKILHEETFGPVAAVAPFDTEDEAVARANATEYGLMAYVHTRDPSRIYRVSRALEFGMLGINRTKVTGAPIPFGGMKQSGLGREGSRHGIEAFSDVKYVCRDWS